MTSRARGYMAIAASRHVILGLLCIFDPQRFTGPGYVGIVGAFPWLERNQAFVLWGTILVVVGLIAAVSAFTANPSHARIGLIGSALVGGAWISGLVYAMAVGALSGYTMLVLLCAVLLKDLTMLRHPVENPFESLIERKKKENKKSSMTLEEVDAEIAQTKEEVEARGNDQ